MFEKGRGRPPIDLMEKDDLIFTLKMAALGALGLVVYIAVSFLRDGGSLW